MTPEQLQERGQQRTKELTSLECAVKSPENIARLLRLLEEARDDLEQWLRIAQADKN